MQLSIYIEYMYIFNPEYIVTVNSYTFITYSSQMLIENIKITVQHSVKYNLQTIIVFRFIV